MGEKAYESYSVLMSVYCRENPTFLQQAIGSIEKQTVQTDDFVLVCDGPLNAGLDAVISKAQERFGDRMNVVRMPVNGGLRKALNEGIRHCKNELIARMDSDDIAYLDRCERQLRIFNRHPEVSICSGTVEEFTDDVSIVDSRRVVPETNAEILKFSKRRNPFNHPCVMYKKSAMEAVGSYQEFHLLEDYYLWIRMLIAGYQGYNIQEPILHMRAGSAMYKRRGGWAHAKSQVYLFRYMRSQGYVTEAQFLSSVILRVGSSMAPNWLRSFVFKKVLRR